MAQKLKVVYVESLYVHGSEAQKLAWIPKKPKSQLPKERPEHIRKIYVDPLALAGMAIACVLLAVLVLGILQLNDAWQEHSRLESYLSDLKVTNSQRVHEYRTHIDTELAREAAENFGYMDASEAEHIRVHVTVPQKTPEPTWWDDCKWFLSQLFANAKR